jgi:hypothetical protein
MSRICKEKLTFSESLALVFACVFASLLLASALALCLPLY